MAVCIRLSRAGRIHKPFYHIGVFDRRTRRDGRSIEQIGFYAPLAEKEPLRIDLERVKHWLGEGADVSATVAALLRKAGMETPAAKREKASKPKVSQAKRKMAETKTRKVKKRTDKRTANSKAAMERKKKTAS